MDRIAFIFGETFIYWSSIILALAAAASVCLFLGFYLRREGNGLSAAVVIPLAIVFSVVFSRFMHWYCRADSYLSFASAMTNYGSGGYALMGVFAGCALAALILRLTKVTENLPFLLDCMSVAGCGGIAVGRLACFFNSQDRGQIVESVQSLPWVYPVINAVSSAQEFRLATFVIQAMVTGVIFVILVAFLFLTDKKRRDGDLTLIFLLLYCASQVALDSTRYDSLFFRSNGFVSIVQVLSAMGLGLGAIVFSVRLVKRNGFHSWYIALWVAFAGLMGLGGYMEYYVQRHGDQPVFAYSWMSAALVGIVFVVLVIRFLSQLNLGPVSFVEKRSTARPKAGKKSVSPAKPVREEKHRYTTQKPSGSSEEKSAEYISLEKLGLPSDLLSEE